MAEEPVCEAGFDVLEREVFELGDESTESHAHGAEHTEGEVGLLSEDIEEAGFLDMEDLGGFESPGIGGVALAGGEGAFGERVTGAEEVDDLFFAGAVDAVDIDGAGLDDEESGGGVAFVEEVFVRLEVTDAGDGGDAIQVIGGEFTEEVAATQRIEEGGLAEVRERACHFWLGGEVAFWCGTYQAFPEDPVDESRSKQKQGSSWAGGRRDAMFTPDCGGGDGGGSSFGGGAV